MDPKVPKALVTKAFELSRSYCLTKAVPETQLSQNRPKEHRYITITVRAVLSLNIGVNNSLHELQHVR
jgi:hypothetical protein